MEIQYTCAKFVSYSARMGIPFTVTTLPGLERVLEEELTQLGMEGVKAERQAVSCSGTEESVYRLNLSLRTGLRVLWEIHRAPIQSVQDLYRETKSLPWEHFIHPHQTIAVSVSCLGVSWASPRYLPLAVKDAVVDRFSEIYGKRPSVDPHAPHLPIHLHLEGKVGIFSLDTSGESLHRRGYRLEKTLAPVNEVLAAGILKLVGWEPKIPLYDPMCGSGTFLVEAGLMAYGIPPGILRTHFAFQNWKVFDKNLYEQVRRELEKSVERLNAEKGSDTSGAAGGTSLGYALIGSDKDPKALEITKRNLIRAGLQGKVRLFPGAFEALPPPFPSEQGGFLLMNPPYGKRLQDPELETLYRSIGNTLKQKYAGVQAWILSGNPEAAKLIGLRPFKKVALKNGPLDCKLFGFTLMKGKYTG